MNTILRDACFNLDRPLIVMAKVCTPLCGIKPAVYKHLHASIEWPAHHSDPTQT